MIVGELDFPNHTPDEVLLAVRRTLQELKWKHAWTDARAEVGRRIPALTYTSSIEVMGTKVRFECRFGDVTFGRGNAGWSRRAIVTFFNRLAFLLDDGDLNRWRAQAVGVEVADAAQDNLLQMPYVGLLALPFLASGNEEGTWDAESGLFHIRSRVSLLRGCLIQLLIVNAVLVILFILLAMRPG
jgi:hypothetical protein